MVSLTSCITIAGGGESDLNLLSKMESNSANCSIVLEDITDFEFDTLTCIDSCFPTVPPEVNLANNWDDGFEGIPV